MFLVAGASGSACAILVDNGQISTHSGLTRDTFNQLISSSACSFVSAASQMQGTSGISLVTFSRTGWYMIGFEQTSGAGKVMQITAGTTVRIGWTDDFVYYLGDTNPFA